MGKLLKLAWTLVNSGVKALGLGGLPMTGIAVAIVLAGLAWVRHEIASGATAKADARCEQRIAAGKAAQDKEDEGKTHDAEDAAERVARADTRAALERVCKGDRACRERQD